MLVKEVWIDGLIIDGVLTNGSATLTLPATPSD